MTRSNHVWVHVIFNTIYLIRNYTMKRTVRKFIYSCTIIHRNYYFMVMDRTENIYIAFEVLKVRIDVIVSDNFGLKRSWPFKFLQLAFLDL